MHSVPKHDPTGFLVEKAKCRNLNRDSCNGDKYLIVDPLADTDAFGNEIVPQDDRPFVCKPVTQCDPETEWRVVEAVPYPGWPGTYIAHYFA